MFFVAIDPRPVYAQNDPVFTQVWSPNDVGLFNTGITWGDYDQDGDLDLAFSDAAVVVGIYRNDGIQTVGSTNPVFQRVWVQKYDATSGNDVAWGDYDGDGDLDLVVATSCNLTNCVEGTANRLYRNDGISAEGIPIFELAWSTPEKEFSTSVAWGDFDNDGDLDLAFGNEAQSNRIYRNDTPQQSGATAIFTSIWVSTEVDHTSAVTWADINGDRFLDLVTGNGKLGVDGGEPARLYLNNKNGTLVASASWSSLTRDVTFDIALTDYDLDGDLDLATANGNIIDRQPTGIPNRIYRNDNGVLTKEPIWSSPEASVTQDIEWADIDADGDPDLLAGNDGIDQLYENLGLENDTLTPKFSLRWKSNDVDGDSTTGLAVADANLDGSLDLAVANFGYPSGQFNKFYRNNLTTLGPGHTIDLGAADGATNAAWGDVDGDGDLDVVISYEISSTKSLQLFRNNGGVISKSAIWSIPATQSIFSVAWGDVDGDYDLDLAVGLAGQNRVYRNQNGNLEETPIWLSNETDTTFDIAWGDYDGDGDLDLTAANSSHYDTSGNEQYEPNRIYRNDNGQLTKSAVWSSTELDASTSVAWGDYDLDGDLDIIFGNGGNTALLGGRDRLYRNDGINRQTNIPIFVAVWQSFEPFPFQGDNTFDLSWGDFDKDGDLDLATANFGGNSRVYRNDNGQLTTTDVWHSNQSFAASSIVWADYDSDGDLDLSIGSGGVTFDSTPIGKANYIFRNDVGKITPEPSWISPELESTKVLNWVDIDNDGDLDMVAINYRQPSRIYTNMAQHASTETNHSPRLVLQRPGKTDSGELFSSAEILSTEQLEIHYILFDKESDKVTKIIPEFSPNGGGQWFPATVGNGGAGTTNLATSEQGVTHTFLWSAKKDIVKSDNVIFRIRAISANQFSPILWPAAQAQSPIFRVTSPWYIRVVNEDGNPIAGAQVFADGQPITQTLTGYTLTDQAGLIAPLAPLTGKKLVALSLQAEATTTRDAHDHWAYRTYLTSLTWEKNHDGTPLIASQNGEQRLLVKKENPLILFNIVASIEWDAEPSYLTQLASGLRQGSDYLYDLTDGQMAFGSVTIYENGQNWQDADIQLLARQDTHAHAYLGGIAAKDKSHVIRVGRGWDRFGDDSQPWDASDGYRTLIHEFGHYALYLWDEYLFYEFDPQGNFVKVSDKAVCTSALVTATSLLSETNASAMYWQYTTSELSARPISNLWSQNCEKTAQTQHNPTFSPNGGGESTWETLRRRYEDTQTPQRWRIVTPIDRGSLLTGPVSIVEDLANLPTINIITNGNQPTPLPLTILGPDGNLYTEGVIVTLYQMTPSGKRPISQGISRNGQLNIYGANNGDQLLVATLNGGLSAVATITTPFKNTLTLLPLVKQRQRSALQPAFVRVIPEFNQDSTEINLLFSFQQFQEKPLINILAPGSDQNFSPQLSPIETGYVGQISFSSIQRGTGFLQATNSNTSIQASYQLQVVSPEAQTIFSDDGNFEVYLNAKNLLADKTVFVIQTMGTIPGTLPATWSSVSDIYDITASGSMVVMQGSGLLTLHYDAKSIEGNKRQRLTIARWDTNQKQWIILPSEVNDTRYVVTSTIDKLGSYALVLLPTNTYLPLVAR